MQTKKDKERRLVAYLLTFVMLAGTFVPFLGVQIAEASVIGDSFDVRLPVNMGAGSNMVHNPDGAQPIFGTDTIPDRRDRQVITSWNFGAFTTHDYRLQVNIANHSRVIIDVERRTAVANVLYRFQQYIDGYGWVDSTRADYRTGGRLAPRFYIHSPIGAVGGIGYAPLSEYLTMGRHPSHPSNPTPGIPTPWFVATTQAGLGISLAEYNAGLWRDYTPYFVIAQPQGGVSTGFSFVYEGYYIHFLWSGNNFEVAISSMTSMLGNLLEFDFWYGPAGTLGTSFPTWTNDDPLVYRQVFLGFNPGEFVTTPIASTDRTVANIVFDEFWGLEDGPGADEVRLRIEFPIPRVWSTATNEFVAPAPGARPMGPAVPTNIVLAGADMGITIDIRDIFDPSAYSGALPNVLVGGGGGSPPFIPVLRTYEVHQGLNEGMVFIEIGELLPGLFFNNASISIVPNAPNLVARDALPTSLPWSYTFLEYSIEFIEEDYVLVITSPYRVPGTYVLMQGSQFALVPPSRAATMPVISPTGESIEIPVVILGGIDAPAPSPQRFQVLFVPGSAPLPHAPGAPALRYARSQIIHHDPDLERDASIGTPRVFEVLDYTLMPITGDLSGDEGLLDMTLRWDLGLVRNVANLLQGQGTYNAEGHRHLVLEYEVNRGTRPPEPGVPHPLDPSPFAIVRMYITSNAGMWVNYRITYIDHAGNQVMRPDGTPFVTESERHMLTLLPENIGGLPGPRYAALINFEEIPAARRGVDPAREIAYAEGRLHFRYPEVYFLNVRPIPVPEFPDVVSGGAGVSESDSLTLDDIGRQQLPAPQNMRVFDVMTLADETTGFANRVSATVEWTIPLEHVMDYLASFYNITTPDGLQALDIEIWMNMYITQDEEYMQTDFLNLAHFNNPDASSTRQYRVRRSFGFSPIDSMTSTRRPEETGLPRVHHWYFSDFPGLNPALAGLYPITDASGNVRERLRNWDVVRIENILLEDYSGPIGSDHTLLNVLTTGGALVVTNILDGLDQNQRYYVAADLVVRHGLVQNPELVYATSLFSELVGFTTQGILEAPDGLDRPPTSPGNLRVYEVGQDFAVLHWDRVPTSVDPASGFFEVIEYEIIRLTDHQMPEHLFNDNSGILSFAEVWDEVYNGPENTLGLRTELLELRLFDGTGFGAPGDDIENLDYDETPDISILSDMTLRPNRLYFYYVRTVQRIYEGDPENPEAAVLRHERYSQWAHVSVTTPAVQAPRNLRVEIDREDYDPLTEVIISFDGPIANTDDLRYGRLILQYQLRPDGEDWATPINMTYEGLTQLTQPVGGFSRFMYTITGLEPNMTYSVRVRLIEPRPDGSYDASLWSNIVDFRTDFDQDEYDRERDTEDWLRRLRELLQDLLRRPYWVTRDTRRDFEVVFRVDRFDALIREASGGNIVLPIEERAERVVYYIPAINYIAANRANIGFTLTRDNMHIIIPAGTVNTHTNHAILETTHRMNLREAEDYFVRMEFDWREISYVQGEETLTDQVGIEFDVVSANDNLPYWDEYVTDVITQHILSVIDETTRETVYRRIRERPPNIEMVHFINNMVEQERQRVIELAEDMLWEVTEESVPVEEFDSNLVILARGFDAATVISAFRFINGVWLPVEVDDFFPDRGFFTRAPGVYVFVGRDIHIPGFEVERHAGNVTAIVARHGLDDLFGRDMIDINANATRMMVAGSVARIAGAPRAANPFNWLNEAGVNISARNPNAYITQQEAVHMLMVAYQNRTGTNIQTLRITNFGAVANVQNLDDRYRQSVSAALQLGLFTDSSFNARGTVTIRELFNMLGTLDARINF